MNDANGVSDVLLSLISDSENSEEGQDLQKRVVTAYQIAFDLVEGEDQDFLLRVMSPLLIITVWDFLFI